MCGCFIFFLCFDAFLNSVRWFSYLGALNWKKNRKWFIMHAWFSLAVCCCLPALDVGKWLWYYNSGIWNRYLTLCACLLFLNLVSNCVMKQVDLIPVWTEDLRNLKRRCKKYCVFKATTVIVIGMASHSLFNGSWQISEHFTLKIVLPYFLGC